MTMYREWMRPIVSVKEIYRTKRKGTPVGEATLACGHTTIVDMLTKPKRRLCYTCRQQKITAWSAPAPVESGPAGESGEGRDA